MAITRRQFLKRASLATAGAVAGPSLFANPLVRRAFADTIGNKYLIVIFLDGGNDGLNTVVPAGNATDNLRNAYEDARFLGSGGLRLLPASLAGTMIGNDPNTGTSLALHPGYQGLANLYNAPNNAVAVIQGCGYPDYNLSHDESRHIWQTASLNPGAYGWVGRHLMGEYDIFDVPAVCVSNTISRDFRQLGTNVLAISRLSGFNFPYDSSHNSDSNAKGIAFRALHTAAAGTTHGLSQTVGTLGGITLDATVSYKSLHNDWKTDRPQAIQDAYADAIDNYGGSVASRLREISKMIYGVESQTPGVNCHFFQFSTGGYDTHSQQGTDGANDQQYGVHRAVGDAIETFYNDMKDLAAEDRVCVVVWSEFSRRITQNESGTDHGSQGPVFVIGGGVNGGVYGNLPDIRQGSLDDEGNTVYTQSPNTSDAYVSTDFRDVFGTILKNWVGMSLGDVQALLPTDAGAAQYNWTSANFNMGFLPVLP
jgi:uncharacterized protein (DUF1501 family)